MSIAWPANRSIARPSGPAIRRTAGWAPRYGSSVCSNAADLLAARLVVILDELAAAASTSEQPPDHVLTARLAAAWALITEADPEVADRTARYTGGHRSEG